MSQDANVIVVAGAPRCGSSLLMRMLYLGGIDVVADLGRVSFEDSHASLMPLDSAFMASCRGRAVKVLDPHRCCLPASETYQVLWLHRDTHEQAKSNIKFMRACGFAVDADHEILLRFSNSIHNDYIEWTRRHRPRLIADVLELHFSDLLTAPERVMTRVSSFLHRPIDVASAADAVIARGPECLNGMLELVAVDARRVEVEVNRWPAAM